MALILFASYISQAACGDDRLAGKWKYQSYRPKPASVSASPTAPTFVTWSPEGLVIIDPDGTTGTLEFVDTPIKLNLKIRVTEGTPRSLSVSAAMPLPGGKQFTNELHGWIVPAELGQDGGDRQRDVIRGAIVLTSDDIATQNAQPTGTTGFFVLERNP